MKPIRVEVVENTLKQDQKTTYRRDYDNVLGFQLSEMPKTLALPDDWHTPLTSQQISFRPPHIWGDIQSPKPFIPSENLVPNRALKSVLKARDFFFSSRKGKSDSLYDNGRIKLYGHARKSRFWDFGEIKFSPQRLKTPATF